MQSLWGTCNTTKWTCVFISEGSIKHLIDCWWRSPKILSATELFCGCKFSLLLFFCSIPTCCWLDKLVSSVDNLKCKSSYVPILSTPSTLNDELSNEKNMITYSKQRWCMEVVKINEWMNLINKVILYGSMYDV
jgi:hypothetical protein